MTRTASRISDTFAAWWADGLISTALVLLLAGYALPWVTFNQANFALNGFDLAEWISLHPVARTESPMLLTAGMIRTSLLWAGCAAALLSFPITLRGMIILLIAAAALPAPQNLLSLNDPNYAQQTLIALLCVVLPVLLIFLRRWRAWILIMVGLCAVVSLSSAAWHAAVLLSDFEIGVLLSVGAVSVSVAGILLCLTSWTLMRSHNKSE